MSTRNLALRHTIRKATIKDCGLINRLAWKAFPPTYQAILTPEQIEYMMHWMYDEASLRRQMTKEGHVYFIIHVEGEPVGYVSVRPEDAGVFHLEKIYVLPDFQGGPLWKCLVPPCRGVCKTGLSGGAGDRAEREPAKSCAWFLPPYGHAHRP